MKRTRSRSIRWAQILLAMCAATAAGRASALPPAYTLTPVAPNAVRTQGNGMNDLGQVVGFVGSPMRAFSWQGGTWTYLETAAGKESSAHAINESGQVVGSFQAPAFNTFSHGQWAEGNLTTLPGLTAENQGFAEDINDLGSVVGFSYSRSVLGFAFFNPHAVLWDDGEVFDLSGGQDSHAFAINNHALIVGTSGAGGPSTPQLPVMWENLVMRELPVPGGALTGGKAYDVNDAGQVVGVSFDPYAGGASRASLWDGDGLIDVGGLGGSDSMALAINNQGLVVGQASDAEEEVQAFVWEAGVMYDLNTLIQDIPGWRLTSAVAVNDSGQILCNARTPYAYEGAVLLTPIPEPATLGLLALGGLAVMRRRKGCPRAIRRATGSASVLLALAGLPLAVFAGGARADFPGYQNAYRIDGPAPASVFAFDVEPLGDVNGDGRVDIGVGAVIADSAYLYSLTEQQATLLSRVDGGSRFGWDVAAVGDVNADGVPDYAVSQQFNGPVVVLSGADRTIGGALPSHPALIQQLDYNAYHIGGLPDQGLALAVLRGVRMAVVVDPSSNRTVAEYTALGPVNIELTDQGDIGTVGDLIGDDGIEDFALVENAGSVWKVHILDGSKKTDTPLYIPSAAGLTLVGQATGDWIGKNEGRGQRTVVGIDDVSGDGRPDILAGAFPADPGFRWDAGAALVYDGSTGDFIYRIDGQHEEDWLGDAVASLGDIDGDGFGDFAVGAPGYQNDPTHVGYVGIYSGRQGALLQTISDGTARFGCSLAPVGDLNGDGITDLAIGNLRFNGSTGAVYVYTSVPEPVTLGLLALGGLALIRRTSRQRSRLAYKRPRSFGVSKRFLLLAPVAGILLAANLANAQVGIYWTAANTNTKIAHADLDGGHVETLVNWGGRGIDIDVTAGKMYYTADLITYGRIYRANLDGTGEEVVVSQAGRNPASVVLDIPHGKMYWTAYVDDIIQSANLDGSDVRTVLNVGLRPAGLDIDPIEGKLYWSETEDGRIRRANLDGTAGETLVTGLDYPVKLAVDPANRKVYWSDTGTDTIKRANLDGSGIETVFASGVTAEPHGVAVDPVNGRLYWSEYYNSVIWRANLDGSNAEVLLTDSFGNGIADLALVIPEPASLGLLALGGLAILRRRRGGGRRA